MGYTPTAAAVVVDSTPVVVLIDTPDGKPEAAQLNVPLMPLAAGAEVCV
jgi:hypothetical protein